MGRVPSSFARNLSNKSVLPAIKKHVLLANKKFVLLNHRCLALLHRLVRRVCLPHVLRLRPARLVNGWFARRRWLALLARRAFVSLARSRLALLANRVLILPLRLPFLQQPLR